MWQATKNLFGYNHEDYRPTTPLDRADPRERYKYYKDRFINNDPRCEPLLRESTDYGRRQIRDMRPEERRKVTSALKRCKYTGNKPDCVGLYDQYVRERGNDQLSNDELSDVEQCRDSRTWTEYGRDVASGVYRHAIVPALGPPPLESDPASSGIGYYRDEDTGERLEYVPPDSNDPDNWDAFERTVNPALYNTAHAAERGTQKLREGYHYAKGLAGRTVSAVTTSAWNQAIRWLMTIFVVIQIIIELNGTINEIIGTKSSFQSRLWTLVLILVQIIWSIGGMRTKLGDGVPVGKLTGLVYFIVTFAGAAVSSFIQIGKIRSDDVETNAYNVVALISKLIQGILAVIFGIMFMVSSNETGQSFLYYWVVGIIAVMEFVIQFMVFLNLV